MNKNRVLLIWIIFLTIDVILTAKGLIDKGAEEINPIAVWIIGVSGFWGLWIYGIIGIYLAITINDELIKRYKKHFKKKNKESMYRTMTYILTFVYGYILINNLRVAFGI